MNRLDFLEETVILKSQAASKNLRINVEDMIRRRSFCQSLDLTTSLPRNPVRDNGQNESLFRIWGTFFCFFFVN